MIGYNYGKFIYLDHNATTPVEPEAVKAMLPYLQEEFGNPSSGYTLGIKAKEGVERARKEVASILGCKNNELIFTSGGTESNNMVLKGLIDFKNPEKFHMITCAVEHPAILNPAVYLMELGVNVTILPVDRFGLVDPDSVQKAILPNTALITIMLANNETGTLQPIKEISNIAREHGIPVHTDAAQAVGKIEVDVSELGVDFLTVAGHKVYGPKGVGALFIRNGRKLTPLMHGASQEAGKRAGTENIILASGLGAACRIAEERLKNNIENMKKLRDRLQELLFGELDGLVLNGHPHERLPNTLNVSVPGLEGGKILEGLPTIMASTGAACHDRAVRLSHVLSAMAVPPEIGMGALRLTVGRSNTMDQIEEAAELIINQVKRMRDGKTN
ncbi:MAG: cysteine desulfurase [Deltaproteobacteria bacterium]|nr:cysteine desulfurase [Deltaproteobacteria bacterium]MBW2117248.1 cysteine desulfurase [Deltaproteobacteria bacterium]MBW2342909.1 cysteine desulfurase [Deltaproteobacteria bacterium]